MAGIGKYDTALNMFVRPPADLDRRHIGFLRYLAERNLIDGAAVHGAPSGPLTEDEPPGPWSAFPDEEPR